MQPRDQKLYDENGTMIDFGPGIRAKSYPKERLAASKKSRA